ncbi:MAG: NAD-dependent epimerase [Parvularculaceae bacterium]
MPQILVTGAAGFIGYHLCERLLRAGVEIVGLDNLNAYYSVELKKARLVRLEAHAGFTFAQADLVDATGLEGLFRQHGFKQVFNLAAQAGVRHSLKFPMDYVRANVEGFQNVLECCRRNSVEHLVFASSSSVYGASQQMPFSVHQIADHPLSVYAASKKANELFAHSYSSLYGLPTTGVRFFTVYGPWGRPDMAVYLFADAIVEGRPIQVFNHGNMERDFTYIDDIVESLVRLGDKPATPNALWDPKTPDPATSYAPYRLYNIGNHSPERLETVITLIENALGRKAVREYLPIQPGDVRTTFADVADLSRDVGFSPSTPIDAGIGRFIEWYKEYHRVSPV